MTSQLSLSKRMWAPTVALMVVMVVIAFFSVSRTKALIEASSVAQVTMQKQLELEAKWALEAERLGTGLSVLAIAQPGEVAATAKANVAQSLKQLDSLGEALRESMSSTEDKAAMAGAAAGVEKLRALAAKAESAAQEGEASSTQFMQQLQATLREVNAGTDAMGNYLFNANAELRNEISAARMKTVYGISVLALLIAFIVFGSTAYLVRAIIDPVKSLIGLAETIAEGDLTHEVRVSRGDELGKLQQALSDMRNELADMVTKANQGADSVQTAAAEIASGNMDLSQRTETTAAHVQQTNSAINDLGVAVRHSAESAATANQLAQGAATVAQRGGEVVGQVVTTMQEINASSKKIADIISVIDGIAFQTNILALNAAVEAARAGEQGRGFAVVAGEVRSLASRSAEAAKEIKSLIGASVDRVEAGTRLVADAGSTMQELVGNVNKVSDVIGEISASTAEQTSHLSGVAQSMVQLDQMAQSNAALVEEGAAAAESLKEQAVKLHQLVSRYRVNGSSAAKGHASRPAAVAASPVSRAPAKASTAPAPRAMPAAKVAAAPAPRPAPSPSPSPSPRPAAGSDDEWETF
jgi:methyl-accepting chemotaxis protein